MEFDGRIIRVLPVRSGTSQQGNEWKRLPFVFAYFENQDQRWEDRVILEAKEPEQMAAIGKYCEKGADGKVIVENGSVKLAVPDIKCRCGWSHNVRDIQKKDGSGTVTMNEMKPYRIEIAAMASQQTGQVAQVQMSQAAQQQVQQPFPPAQGGESDDLPF